MDKLKIIFWREFLAKVKNKSFILLTFAMPFLIIGMVMLIVFLNTTNTQELKKVAIVDKTNLFKEAFVSSKAISYHFLSDTITKKQIEKNINAYDGVLWIPKTSTPIALEKQIILYTKKSPGIGLLTTLEQTIAHTLQQIALEKLHINIAQLEATKASVTISTHNFLESSKHAKTSKMGQYLKMALGGGMGYVIFMFIIIYGNAVMRSVIEEKTSRIIEVILSCVKPFYLMLGKILGNGMAAVLQFIIWIASIGILGMVIPALFFKDLPESTLLTDNPLATKASSTAVDITTITPSITDLLQDIAQLPLATMLICFLLYFIIGYLLYSSLYAAIGAAVDSETDTQQFMLPVLLPLTVAVYVGFSVIENPHGPIAMGFSLFPLTSPVIMLIRIPFGVPLWQILLSLCILACSFLLLVWMAAKIYKVGVLSYGKKPSYKELYKWLRY